ncbi:hypothetical protein L3X38_021904 [Prunus dulcis]|uniref:Protein kinase domain-containing protein n=1 Tax=Prunus dulcis TaxID=3755 RepID=A0AAD4Z4N7_PRUDU|nr:hypothetical protein L3X38_021904 [Prunus dulcis]
MRGNIPIGIGNLSSLILLDLGLNQLSGTIPNFIRKTRDAPSVALNAPRRNSNWWTVPKLLAQSFVSNKSTLWCSPTFRCCICTGIPTPLVISIRIVHCDMKPKHYILLDDDMVAHVADFGIAKLLDGGDSITQTMTPSHYWVYGSSEYGLEGMVSTRGDCVQFRNCIVMETFTRRKPTR